MPITLESIERNSVIANTQIHEEAGLKPKEFLDRVSSVEQIRTWDLKNFLSFYITSEKEFTNLAKFYEIVNNGSFEREDNRYIFLFYINSELENWFTTTPLITIQKQIIHWLAAHYCTADSFHKKIMEEQLYKPVLDEIKFIVSKYYVSSLKALDYLNFEGNKIKIEDVDALDESTFKSNKIIEDFERKYLDAVYDYCGSYPPALLKTPFNTSQTELWDVEEFDFKMMYSYFRNDDWERIIENKGEDDMMRAESNGQLWDIWKQKFINKHKLYLK